MSTYYLCLEIDGENVKHSQMVEMTPSQVFALACEKCDNGMLISRFYDVEGEFHKRVGFSVLVKVDGKLSCYVYTFYNGNSQACKRMFDKFVRRLF